MPPKGRKKTGRGSESMITLYPIKYVGFDGLRDISFSEDRGMLEQHGIPVPPTSLNIGVSNRKGIYQLVKHVLTKYEEFLVDRVTNADNGKFEKRKTMFMKLIAAVTVRWYSIYRWKTFDRMMIRSLNVEAFGTGKRLYEKTCENLHVYQILWQEHCNTVKQLLEEWNEAKSIIGTYELRDVTEANCEMTDVMDHLNEMMQTVTLDHVPAVCESRLDELNLATLLSGVQCDVAGDQNRLFMSKKQKINEFQTMINLGINNFENILASLSVHFQNLAQFSRLLSHKMFKKMKPVEYIRKLTDLPSSTTMIQDLERFTM